MIRHGNVGSPWKRSGIGLAPQGAYTPERVPQRRHVFYFVVPRRPYRVKGNEKGLGMKADPTWEACPRVCVLMVEMTLA